MCPTPCGRFKTIKGPSSRKSAPKARCSNRICINTTASFSAMSGDWAATKRPCSTITWTMEEASSSCSAIKFRPKTITVNC